MLICSVLFLVLWKTGLFERIVFSYFCNGFYQNFCSVECLIWSLGNHLQHFPVSILILQQQLGKSRFIIPTTIPIMIMAYFLLEQVRYCNWQDCCEDKNWHTEYNMIKYCWFLMHKAVKWKNYHRILDSLDFWTDQHSGV